MSPKIIHPLSSGWPFSIAAFLVVLTCSSLSTRGSVFITPAPGFSITWDGNDGAHFGQAVPDNLALARNGALAISSGQYGPEVSLPYHLTSNINDGFYGNNASWIGGRNDPVPGYAGVAFPTAVTISSIAFGRDNGNAGSEFQQYTDRSEGAYTLQYTTDGSTWETIGSVTYTLQDDDGALGGNFSSHFRHEFALATDQAAPIVAKGFRIQVPRVGDAGVAIDELEVYGTAVPEPVSSSIAALALGAWILRRRRLASRRA